MLNVRSGISVMGKPVTIPIRKSLGFSHLQAFEPWMGQLMQKLRGMFKGHFVDIGVNLGQTLIKAKAVFGDFHYTGFEPNPYCIAYLKELVSANNWKDCNIIPVGISDKTTVLKLNFFGRDDVDPRASIVSEFRTEKITHTSYVPVANEADLNGLLPEVRHCLTKIDVEGAELEVLNGLKGWITRTRPVIIIEILPVYNEGNQFRLTRQQQMEALLSQMSYTILRLTKPHDQLEGITEINSIGIHGEIELCDYILCPAEIKDNILTLVNAK
jgi:FkbM family methyltransferase